MARVEARARQEINLLTKGLDLTFSPGDAVALECCKDGVALIVVESGDKTVFLRAENEQVGRSILEALVMPSQCSDTRLKRQTIESVVAVFGVTADALAKYAASNRIFEAVAEGDRGILVPVVDVKAELTTGQKVASISDAFTSEPVTEFDVIHSVTALESTRSQLVDLNVLADDVKVEMVVINEVEDVLKAIPTAEINRTKAVEIRTRGVAKEQVVGVLKNLPYKLDVRESTPDSLGKAVVVVRLESHVKKGIELPAYIKTKNVESYLVEDDDLEAVEGDECSDGNGAKGRLVMQDGALYCQIADDSQSDVTSSVSLEDTSGQRDRPFVAKK